MSSITFHVFCLPFPKTRDRFINWIRGKLSHIFSSATFNSVTVLGFSQRFQNSFVCHSTDMTSPWQAKKLGDHFSFSIISGKFSQRHG